MGWFLLQNTRGENLSPELVVSISFPFFILPFPPSSHPRPPFPRTPPNPFPVSSPPHPFHSPPSPPLKWGSGSTLLYVSFSDYSLIFGAINVVSGERLFRNKLFKTRLLIVLFNNININIVLHSINEMVKTKIRDDTWWSETNNEDGGDLLPTKVEQINDNIFIDTNKSNIIKSGMNEMRVNDKLIMKWVWIHEMKCAYL